MDAPHSQKTTGSQRAKDWYCTDSKWMWLSAGRWLPEDIQGGTPTME